MSVLVILSGGYTAFAKYTDQRNYQDAQKAVNKLFSDKEHEILANDVDAALLKVDQSKINLVKNRIRKEDLRTELIKARNLFNAEELAKRTVSALLKNGIVVDQITLSQMNEALGLVTSLTDKPLKAKLQKVIDDTKVQFNALTNATHAVTALFTDATHLTLAEKVDRNTYDGAKTLVDGIQNNSKKKELMDLLSSANTLLTDMEKKEAEAKAAAEAKAIAEAKAAAIASAKAPLNASKTSSENQSSGNSSNSVNPPTVQPGGQQETGFAKIVANSKTAQRTDQIVTVVASGTSANVTLWEKSNGVWGEVLTTKGYVGSQGVGTASEGSKRTPNGAYTLGFAFGKTNPGTKLPFKQITDTSYWISDVNSDLYNTWQEGNYAGNGNEHLADYANLQYYYAIVIDYNTSAVRGAGSAFFLHVSNGRPTAGCVSVPKNIMESFMQRIHKGAYIINVTSQSEVGNY